MGEHRFGHRPQCPGDHDRAADLGRRHFRGRGDGLGEHAVEGALAQLAADQAGQQSLFGRRCPRHQPPEPIPAGRRGAAAAFGGDPFELGVDLADLKRRLRRRWGQVAERGVAQAGPPLAQLAGQERDDDGNLVRTRPAQAVGQQPGLGQPARLPGDRRGGLGQVVEQHNCRVCPTYRAQLASASLPRVISAVRVSPSRTKVTVTVSPGR